MFLRTVLLSVALLAAAPAQSADGDAAAGVKIFKKCKACHVVDKPKNRVGPHLVDIIGREVASIEGYKYSKALKAYAAEVPVWDIETLNAYIAAPRAVVKGTKMAFAGIKKEQQLLDLIAYLRAPGEAK